MSFIFRPHDIQILTYHPRLHGGFYGVMHIILITFDRVECILAYNYEFGFVFMVCEIVSGNTLADYKAEQNFFFHIFEVDDTRES